MWLQEPQGLASLQGLSPVPASSLLGSGLFINLCLEIGGAGGDITALETDYGGFCFNQ